MSAVFPRDLLEKKLGFVPEFSEKPVHSLAICRMELNNLVKQAEKWGRLPEGEKPVLKGISTSPAEETRVFLNLLLDLGGGFPVLCIEIDSPRDRIFPDLSAVWPYCALWQEELAAFSGLRFDRKGILEGISWRLA